MGMVPVLMANAYTAPAMPYLDAVRKLGCFWLALVLGHSAFYRWSDLFVSALTVIRDNHVCSLIKLGLPSQYVYWFLRILPYLS
jgi:hypothetical protein